MNITQEKIDDLNAVVKVKLGPEDYQQRVEKVLKDYQKRVSMPGFRPGKVPQSLVKKMYGKNALADELNHILSDSIYKYIRENKIDVLGNPLPKSEVNDKVDFDHQTEFEFAFDMALAPQFELSLGPDMQYTEYVIRTDDKLVDNYVNDISRRYGKIEPADKVEESDLVYGDFVELDEKGEIVPGGIFKSSTLFIDKPVKEEHKMMIGAKAEDKFDMEAKQVAATPKELSSKLGVDEKTAETLQSKFRFTIKTISRLIPAELNKELFEKVYGPGVETETDFRARISTEVENMFRRDSEDRLRNEISADLLNRTNLTLPDSFLKRWLVHANEKPVTMEQVEAEYPLYARQLRWQLIENKLIRDNNISVTPEEATEHVKQTLRENLAKYGRKPDEMSDAELNDTAKRILEKEEEAKKVFEKLYSEKLMLLYRTKCTITQKEVSPEEFAAH